MDQDCEADKTRHLLALVIRIHNDRSGKYIGAQQYIYIIIYTSHKNNCRA